MSLSLNESVVLDAKDRMIIDLVQRDGKLAQAEIARRVGLSTAAVSERLKKLEQAGVIRHYAAIVDPHRAGSTLAAFIEVFMEHPRHEPAFIERMLALDEVQEVHHITGDSSLLLKVRARDMGGLQELLLHELNAFEGVRQTRTIMVLSTLKETCYVPTGRREVKT